MVLPSLVKDNHAWRFPSMQRNAGVAYAYDEHKWSVVLFVCRNMQMVCHHTRVSSIVE